MHDFCLKVTHTTWFQNLIIGVIIFAGILVGLETSTDIMTAYGTTIHILDQIVLWFFVLEAIIKMISHWPKPWNYFREGWNVFDFLIVAVCFLPFGGPYVAVLRLARLLRVLRLVTVLPRMQILVGTLLKSIPSMGYVGLMLALHFYIFAVLGVFLFGVNDPLNFGSLPVTLLSLFETVTLEGWIETMDIQRLGSAAFPDLYSGTNAISTPHPLIAPAYFISFILLGTMIMLNLFIGVIMNSMQEMHEEMQLSAVVERLTEENQTAENRIDHLIKQLGEIEKNLRELKIQTKK